MDIRKQMIIYSNNPKFKFSHKKDFVKVYDLKEDFTFFYDKNFYIIVAGFETDFASIPYPLSKWIKRKNDNYLVAPIIHDFLYSKNNQVKSVTRKIADKAFKDCMTKEGTPKRYKYPFYYAVRLFGYRYFRI